MQKQAGLAVRIIALATLILLTGTMDKTNAQQKELPEVTLLTAVPNFAFAAIWVAEQLKYFEQEGVRVKITPAPSGSVCLNAVVGRSTNFCASTSEGLVLARVEGAPAMAIQAHNRAMTLSVVLRKAVVDKLGVTRESPIGARLKALTHLGTIGATGPGAASEQIFKFLVKKAGAGGTILKFVYIGAPELPPSLMNNVIELSHNMVAGAMPRWGTMSAEGWQKVINFATGAGIVKDLAQAPSNKEGVLWTNKYVGKP